MQRDEQLMTASDDSLIKEIAENLVIVKHSNDYAKEKERLVETVEDLLELIKRKCG